MPVKFVGGMQEPTSHLGKNGPYVQSWTTQLQKELRIHEQLILEQTELYKKIEVLSVELHNIWSENSQLQYLYSNTNVHEPVDLPNTTLELNNMTLSNPSAYSTLEAKVEKLHTRRVRRRRGRLPSSARQNLRTLVMQSSQCTFLLMTYTAENPHADGSAAPGARPRFRPPLQRHPTPRLPHPRQQDGGKIDVLSSANGPSTVALQQRCLYRTSASARSPS